MTNDAIPERFEGVTVVAVANVYFDGGVISHTVLLGDGSKKTLGLIREGGYSFDTAAPERMQITAGSCRVKLAGEASWTTYEAGQFFDVPGHSRFDIAVDRGMAQYICSFG